MSPTPQSSVLSQYAQYLTPSLSFYNRTPVLGITSNSKKIVPSCPTPHGASRLVQAMSAWSAKTRPSPSRIVGMRGSYGHTTTAMHDMSTRPPLLEMQNPDIRREMRRKKTSDRSRATTPVHRLTCLERTTSHNCPALLHAIGIRRLPADSRMAKSELTCRLTV